MPPTPVFPPPSESTSTTAIPSESHSNPSNPPANSVTLSKQEKSRVLEGAKREILRYMFTIEAIPLKNERAEPIKNAIRTATSAVVGQGTWFAHWVAYSNAFLCSSTRAVKFGERGERGDDGSTPSLQAVRFLSSAAGLSPPAPIREHGI